MALLTTHRKSLAPCLSSPVLCIGEVSLWHWISLVSTARHNSEAWIRMVLLPQSRAHRRIYLEASSYPRRAQCQSPATLAVFGCITAWRFSLLSVTCDCCVDLFSSQPSRFTTVLVTPQPYNTLTCQRYPLRYTQPSPFSFGSIQSGKRVIIHACQGNIKLSSNPQNLESSKGRLPIYPTQFSRSLRSPRHQPQSFYFIISMILLIMCSTARPVEARHLIARRST